MKKLLVGAMILIISMSMFFVVACNNNDTNNNDNDNNDNNDNKPAMTSTEFWVDLEASTNWVVAITARGQLQQIERNGDLIRFMTTSNDGIIIVIRYWFKNTDQYFRGLINTSLGPQVDKWLDSVGTIAMGREFEAYVDFLFSNFYNNLAIEAQPASWRVEYSVENNVLTYMIIDLDFIREKGIISIGESTVVLPAELQEKVSLS